MGNLYFSGIAAVPSIGGSFGYFIEKGKTQFIYLILEPLPHRFFVRSFKFKELPFETDPGTNIFSTDIGVADQMLTSRFKAKRWLRTVILVWDFMAISLQASKQNGSSLTHSRS